MCKILEGLVPNIFPPICTKPLDRRGKTCNCITSHIHVGGLGTLEYNSFRHFYFRTCRRDNGGHDILMCRMILLFYYFLVIGHFNNIIEY